MEPQAKQDGKFSRNPTQRSIAMFTWGFLGFICLCLLSQWVSFNRRDQAFTAYADRLIQIGVKQQSTARDVRAWLLIKANDLSMTIRPEEIRVTGDGPTLKATVHYYADLSMPVVNEPVYRVSFRHDLAHQ